MLLRLAKLKFYWSLLIARFSIWFSNLSKNWPLKKFSNYYRAKLNIPRIKFSPLSRYLFIILAFIFLAISACCLFLVLINNENQISEKSKVKVLYDVVKNDDYKYQLITGNTKNEPVINSLLRIRSFLNKHRTIVIVLSISIGLFQVLAIGAAIFNCPTILFGYIVITCIFGTTIGLISIVGIIFTCLLMKNTTESNYYHHILTISLAIIVTFIFIFYLITLIALRLINYIQRNSKIKKKKNHLNGKLSYYNKLSFNHKRRLSSLYRSMNSHSLPIGIHHQSSQKITAADEKNKKHNLSDNNRQDNYYDIDDNDDEDDDAQMIQLSSLLSSNSSYIPV